MIKIKVKYKEQKKWMSYAEYTASKYNWSHSTTSTTTTSSTTCASTTTQYNGPSYQQWMNGFPAVPTPAPIVKKKKKNPFKIIKQGLIKLYDGYKQLPD